MSDRPSEGWELEELREEFDWMYEFNSRMAERITDDPDVHSLAAYVEKLERTNADLRELVVEVFRCARRGAGCETCKAYNDGYACVYIMRELGIEVDDG